MSDTFTEEEWPAELRKIVSKTFSDDDIQVLCHDLGIDYEELRGETKRVKIIKLIELCRQTGKQLKLIDTCAEIRPNIPWTELRQAAETYPAVIDKPSNFSPTETEITKPLISKSSNGTVLRLPPNVLLYGAIGLAVAILMAIVVVTNPGGGSAGSGDRSTAPPLVATFTGLPPTSSAVFSRTTVNVMKVATFGHITMTVDYVAFQSNRVMIHITLDNTEGEREISNCGLPTLIKSEYGAVPVENITERGGFLSKADRSCFLVGNIIVNSGEKQEGWVTYEVDANRFITTGLYTIGDIVFNMPVTTFEIK